MIKILTGNTELMLLRNLPVKDGWHVLNLSFKQSYDGAYLYLDRCGDFMGHMRSAFGFYALDAQPTGCKLDLPERKIQLTADTTHLSVIQEEPGSDYLEYLRIVHAASARAQSIFQPFEVYRNGFLIRLIKQMSSPEAAYRESLRVGEDHAILGEVLGLSPRDKELKVTFSSGSYELDVKMETVSLKVSPPERSLAHARSSKAQMRYIEERNRASETLLKPSSAFMVQVDLMEMNPAEGSLDTHFKLFQKYTQQLVEKLSSQ